MSEAARASVFDWPCSTTPRLMRGVNAQRGDFLRPFVATWFECMRQRGSDVRELVHDGCPTACVGDAAFGYVNAFTNYVNVGFFLGALLNDPARLLEGTGKRGRHVKLGPGRKLIPQPWADSSRRRTSTSGRGSGSERRVFRLFGDVPRPSSPRAFCLTRGRWRFRSGSIILACRSTCCWRTKWTDFSRRRTSRSALTLDDLQIPRLERFRFHYSQQPLSYASTPYRLAHLLRRGFSRVVFLKQESLVLDSFASLYARLASESLVLTPHLLAPLEGADRITRELNILQSGTFNIGLVGVAGTPSAHRFLAWWQDRVFTHCRHAVGEGMHYEQRWIDLAPALFDGVHILRDPAYNVGHWNLPERRIAVEGERVTVDEPCRLFRFSGYNPDDPGRLTRAISRRLTADNAGPAVEVFDRYRNALERAGYHETKRWPYAYATFDNGVPIPDIARQIYLDQAAAGQRFGDPRCTTGSDSFFAWLNESYDY